MKFLYLFIAILCLVALTILYFQMVVSVSMQVPFFDIYIDINKFTLYLVLLALLCGIFFTLGIK